MSLFESGAKLRVCRKGREITKVTVIAVLENGDLAVEDNFNPDKVAQLHYLESVESWIVNLSEGWIGVFNPNFHYLLGFAE